MKTVRHYVDIYFHGYLLELELFEDPLQAETLMGVVGPTNMPTDRLVFKAVGGDVHVVNWDKIDRFKYRRVVDCDHKSERGSYYHDDYMRCSDCDEPVGRKLNA